MGGEKGFNNLGGLTIVNFPSELFHERLYIIIISIIVVAAIFIVEKLVKRVIKRATLKKSSGKYVETSSRPHQTCLPIYTKNVSRKKGEIEEKIRTKYRNIPCPLD